MATKTILNFKNGTYNKFLITYLGARAIQPTLTKVSLVSALIENNLNDRICTFAHKSGKTYTFSELYTKGLNLIKNSFADILNIKHDDSFLLELKRLDIDELCEMSNYDENLNYKLVRTVLKKSFDSFFTSPDFDSLTDVVHPLGSYEDEEADGAFASEEKVYVYAQKSTQKEYWVFEEVKEILKRYKKIRSKYKYYSVLTNFIFEQIDKLGLNNKYEFYSTESLLNTDNNTVEFYNEFFTLLETTYAVDNKYNLPKCININNEFQEDDLKYLRSFTTSLIKETSGLDYTYFNPDDFLYLLIEKDLRKIIRTSLSLDFNEYLTTSLIGDGSDIYYKKAFIEKLQINLNEPKSTIFKVKLKF